MSHELPQNTRQDPSDPGGVTMLLLRAGAGDSSATDELLPLVYDELRGLAAKHLSAERPDHTLQATALVHEAYMRLVGPADVTWDSRAHFFGAAAIAIRRILTDHARTHNSAKRGGGAARVPMSDPLASSPESEVDVPALGAALDQLAALDPQKAKVVELRFFAGLTAEETALALGVSASTVARDWQFARVWLRRELSRGETA